eukprot:TRINITY_DN321_c1_g2_i1.p1 TRINITY_DN321_c1_g2~~TRINITY_DN321_c1_g2_i1.p1  ORF type:complete len:406 (-),score=189.42 TRINITY_DN321_c1_g2_i1:80-1297(-)
MSEPFRCPICHKVFPANQKQHVVQCAQKQISTDPRLRERAIEATEITETIKNERPNSARGASQENNNNNNNNNSNSNSDTQSNSTMTQTKKLQRANSLTRLNAITKPTGLSPSPSTTLTNSASQNLVSLTSLTSSTSTTSTTSTTTTNDPPRLRARSRSQLMNKIKQEQAAANAAVAAGVAVQNAPPPVPKAAPKKQEVDPLEKFKGANKKKFKTRTSTFAAAQGLQKANSIENQLAVPVLKNSSIQNFVGNNSTPRELINAYVNTADIQRMPCRCYSGGIENIAPGTFWTFAITRETTTNQLIEQVAAKISLPIDSLKLFTSSNGKEMELDPESNVFTIKLTCWKDSLSTQIIVKHITSSKSSSTDSLSSIANNLNENNSNDNYGQNYRKPKANRLSLNVKNLA